MSVRDKIMEESRKAPALIERKQKGFNVLLSEDDFITINKLRTSPPVKPGVILSQKSIFLAMLHLTDKNADFRKQVVELASEL